MRRPESKQRSEEHGPANKRLPGSPGDARSPPGAFPFARPTPFFFRFFFCVSSSFCSSEARVFRRTVAAHLFGGGGRCVGPLKFPATPAQSRSTALLAAVGDGRRAAHLYMAGSDVRRAQSGVCIRIRRSSISGQFFSRHGQSRADSARVVRCQCSRR